MSALVKHIWPVTLRLEESFGRNTQARKWIWEKAIPYVIKKNLQNIKGVYDYLEDGTLVFLGLESKQFPYTFGYFPEEFPRNDEYQPIYKGMRASEFENFLKGLGFIKINQQEED